MCEGHLTTGRGHGNGNMPSQTGAVVSLSHIQARNKVGVHVAADTGGRAGEKECSAGASGGEEGKCRAAKAAEVTGAHARRMCDSFPSSSSSSRVVVMCE